MAVYITCLVFDYGDPYEGWHDTSVDSVWSRLDKARERIAELANAYVKERVERLCGSCSEPCTDHDCVYESIDNADPNKIVINEGSGVSATFYIIERRMDIPFKEVG